RKFDSADRIVTDVHTDYAFCHASVLPRAAHTHAANPTSDRYPCHRKSPKKIPTQAPSNIHGPKGIPLLRFALRSASSMTEKIPPSRKAEKPPMMRLPQPSQPK